MIMLLEIFKKLNEKNKPFYILFTLLYFIDNYCDFLFKYDDQWLNDKATYEFFWEKAKVKRNMIEKWDMAILKLSCCYYQKNY